MSLFSILMLPLAVGLAGAQAVLPRQAPGGCTSSVTLPGTVVYVYEPLSTWVPGAATTTNPGPISETTTVYETVYSTFCPACTHGLGPSTYTLTQVCPGGPGSPCRPRGDNCPPGFHVVVSVCHHCGDEPLTATLTLPLPEKTATYEAAYPYFCPTGLETKTYTVAQVCRDDDPCDHPGDGRLPPGFTESVGVCATCGPNPITATLTVPAGGVPTGGAAVTVTKPLGPATETGAGDHPVYVAGAVGSPAWGFPALVLVLAVPVVLFRFGL
ncbi:hypothetical protein QBC33DRAFT_538342 [Phialemonium atrogriseum]|uniref:Uncharacterized protein n=1 Tax=Phialemonium atrogriseum TaxID=1093897 RepID=A0AAJ0FH86_9PEZI|nr:uncharacterized protein QBC33DRAFT_538342 [Phialemonium atrogriseum]KAK1767442.1 hypothetical protein QBC33DRAFT_538342 [Phialemonium atrogriseum]